MGMGGVLRCGVCFAVAATMLVLRGCGKAQADPAAPAAVMCSVELHSWVVASPHPGRHLYLQIIAPAGYEHLNARVEFTSAAMRWDYDPWSSGGNVPRVAMMSRGARLRPMFGDGSETDVLEYTYSLTVEQVECLLKDRMWRAPYLLLGTNSTSGMRSALEDCGCTLPARVLAGGGVLGSFPGVDQDPGELMDGADWAEFGVPLGPTGVPEAGRGLPSGGVANGVAAR